MVDRPRILHSQDHYRVSPVVVEERIIGYQALRGPSWEPDYHPLGRYIVKENCSWSLADCLRWANETARSANATLGLA